MEAPSLSLVVPMYNEEGSVASLINDIHLSLKSINYELILVDDKSEDETVETVQNLLANLLKHETKRQENETTAPPIGYSQNQKK